MTTRMIQVPGPSEADEKRLRAAGYAPVVRWVHVVSRATEELKTVEALTLLDRIGKSDGS